MATLQAMVGGAELTEETMRSAIASLTPSQRRKLVLESRDLKRELLTKREHAEERNIYFKEVNRSADDADLPVDKDGTYLAKKVSDFMATSNGDIPHAYMLEALASSPYLIKAALAEARDPSRASAATADLAEIEAALSLLKVVGFRPGEDASRPPFVRRNLLLLNAHLHRERLRALVLAESTSTACVETVDKARRLLDMHLAYCLQVGWVRATLCITELQGLVTNGLWDPTEDECRSHMKQKLGAVGLKLPKISVQGYCSDVAPGERVKLNVTLTRMHAHSRAEAQALRDSIASSTPAPSDQPSEAGSEAPVEPVLQRPPPGADGEGMEEGCEYDDFSYEQQSLAAAFGGEDAALGKEGWWLVVESLRGHLNLQRQGMKDTEPVHNMMVGRQALSPSLDDPQWCADIEFDAPTTPGEYKVVIHVRSSTMIGVDAKRKVSFSVRAPKRSLPSSSSHSTDGSTEPIEAMEAMDAAIAEIEEGLDEGGGAEGAMTTTDASAVSVQ